MLLKWVKKKLTERRQTHQRHPPRTSGIRATAMPDFTLEEERRHVPSLGPHQRRKADWERRTAHIGAEPAKPVPEPWHATFHHYKENDD